MTVVLLLLLGCVIGWVSRSALATIRAVHLERRGVGRPNAQQTRSEIRARSRRAEEQMRRAAFRARR